MGGLVITLELYNLDAVEAAWDPEILKLQAEQAAPKLGKSALDEMRRAYQAQQDPDGATWPALSEKYRAWKERTHPGKGMLHLEEQLFASLGWVRDDDPSFVLVGAIKSPPPYAKAQNYGFPGSNLPAREFVGVSESFAQRAKEAYESLFSTGEWDMP